jgi:hypothetical protein
VIRAGYGRSYDIGVFGSLFGHPIAALALAWKKLLCERRA